VGDSSQHMKTALRFISVFVSGALYEALAVVWVHQATSGAAINTALISGLQALTIIIGVGESTKNWRIAPAFVLGYAVGAYAAMVLP